jgi:hypothetical protein
MHRRRGARGARGGAHGKQQLPQGCCRGSLGRMPAAVQVISHDMVDAGPLCATHLCPLSPNDTWQALFVTHKQRTEELPATAQGPGYVAVRLHNYGQLMHMRQLKSKSIGERPPLNPPMHPGLRQASIVDSKALSTADPQGTEAVARPHCAPAPPVHLGHLVTIRGTVVRMSHIRPLIVEMGFSCAKCGAEQRAAFPDGRFAPPTSCTGESRVGGWRGWTKGCRVACAASRSWLDSALLLLSKHTVCSVRAFCSMIILKRTRLPTNTPPRRRLPQQDLRR